LWHYPAKFFIFGSIEFAPIDCGWFSPQIG